LKFTAPSESVSISLEPGSWQFAIAAYRGSPGQLTEVGCRSFDGNPLTIRATAGETVYLDLFAYDWAGSFTTNVSIDRAAAPQPAFGFWPPDPAAVDEIGFFDLSADPGGNAVATVLGVRRRHDVDGPDPEAPLHRGR
jgi:hypothetical protein